MLEKSKKATWEYNKEHSNVVCFLVFKFPSACLPHFGGNLTHFCPLFPQIKFMALTGLLLVGQINISEQEQSTASSVSTDDKTATIQYKPVTSLSSNDNTLACHKTASTSLL